MLARQRLHVFFEPGIESIGKIAANDGRRRKRHLGVLSDANEFDGGRRATSAFLDRLVGSVDGVNALKDCNAMIFCFSDLCVGPCVGGLLRSVGLCLVGRTFVGFRRLLFRRRAIACCGFDGRRRRCGDRLMLFWLGPYCANRDERNGDRCRKEAGGPAKFGHMLSFPANSGVDM